MNRLSQEVGALGQTTTHTYDDNGNRLTTTDPLTHATTNTYDALNRLLTVTQPGGPLTRYAYDKANNLTSVIDPRALTTSYGYDGPDNPVTQVSPDTGTTTRTFDAGNVATSTDARGVVPTYRYDNANRVTQVEFTKAGFPTETHAYTWDVGTPHAAGATEAGFLAIESEPTFLFPTFPVLLSVRTRREPDSEPSSLTLLFRCPMSSIEEKFAKLGIDHAPGQEGRQRAARAHTPLLGENLPGIPVDFSHGDVNGDSFAPTPGALDEFVAGVNRGGSQAYTEYRGEAALRDRLAGKLAAFTGRPVSGAEELIITPGTQGALFLALASAATSGDKVAIVQPDYFANRKLVEFLGAEVVPVRLDHLAHVDRAGLDLDQLQRAFESGARTFLFSNPNNPAGVIYAPAEIERIAALAERYGVTVIVDQLYSRLLYPGRVYTHLRASPIVGGNVVTIMGPSKTESLSGYRLGVAFGPARLIDRMEKLQAIVSLRAPGYCQAVLRTWFDEPAGWMQQRIAEHQVIRDELLGVFATVPGLAARAPEAGSYLFPRLPALGMSLHGFVRALRQQAGVTVTPGTEFSPHATDSIRLNFSQNRAAAVHAVGRIARLIERYRA